LAIQSNRECMELIIPTFSCHSVVLETLLRNEQMIEIPHWLLSSFGNWCNFYRGLHGSLRSFAGSQSDPARLIRILLCHDRTLDACKFAVTLLRAMTVKEIFNRDSLSNLPWFPHKLMDQLSTSLMLESSEEFTVAAVELEAAITDYVNLVNKAQKTSSVGLKYFS